MSPRQLRRSAPESGSGDIQIPTTIFGTLGRGKEYNVKKYIPGAAPPLGYIRSIQRVNLTVSVVWAGEVPLNEYAEKHNTQAIVVNLIKNGRIVASQEVTITLQLDAKLGEAAGTANLGSDFFNTVIIHPRELMLYELRFISPVPANLVQVGAAIAFSIGPFGIIESTPVVPNTMIYTDRWVD